MGKRVFRAFVILLIAVLGPVGTLCPAAGVYAQEKENKEENKEDNKDKDSKGEGSTGKENGSKKTGTGIGEELYRKMDEAVSGIDKQSLRRQVREALREMDQKGISPTVIARDLFGIGQEHAGSGKKTENTLLEDAEKTVRRSTEKFFSTIWNGFLNTLGGVIETGLNVFSGEGGK